MDQTTFNWTLGALAGVMFFALGGGLLLMRRAHKEAQLARQRALDGQVVQEDGADGQSRLMYAIHRIGEMASRGRYSTSLKRDLIMAGYHSASAPMLYVGAKLFLLVLGTVGAILILLPVPAPLALKVVVTLFAAGMLFFIPNLVVKARRGRRMREVQFHLPDAVDLLEICVSSGMGLDMAWNCVSGEIRRVSPLLSDEMELTNLEMNLGVARPEAMRHMAERTGSQDISSLVALLVQAERFGASIIDALSMFAKSMREIRSTRAEEAAEKMAVKLLFPMVLFIFPSLLIVMVGPAVMQIVDVMM